MAPESALPANVDLASVFRGEPQGVDGGALSALLSVLADLPDGEAVGQAVMQGVLGPYGCDLALVYALRPDGTAHDLVAGYGLAQRETAIYSSVPADSHLPGAEAARTGTDRIMAAGEVADNYPLAAPFFRVRPPEGDIAFMVIRHRGRRWVSACWASRSRCRPPGSCA